MDTPPDDLPDREPPARLGEPQAVFASGPQAPETEQVPRRVKLAWTVGILAGLVAVFAIPAITTPTDSPEETVTGFFDAITAKDVDTALTFVEPSAIPAGGSAGFLVPGAIRDDWKLVSIDGVRAGEYSTERRVDVTIGGPDGTAEGTFVLTEDDDTGWLLTDPFTMVTFAPSPLGYSQVNGYTPKEQARTVSPVGRRYELLPGMYTFYEDIPGSVSVDGSGTLAVLPLSEHAEPEQGTYHPGRVSAKRKAVSSANQRFNDLLDDCATRTLARPSGCPFGVGEFVNTKDGRHVEGLNDLSWEVKEYPKVGLVDSRYGDAVDPDARVPAFTVTTESEGVVTLTGTGIDTDDKKADFTVHCRVEPAGFTATSNADGTVELNPNELDGYADYGPGTCGKKE